MALYVALRCVAMGCTRKQFARSQHRKMSYGKRGTCCLHSDNPCRQESATAREPLPLSSSSSKFVKRPADYARLRVCPVKHAHVHAHLFSRSMASTFPCLVQAQAKLRLVYRRKTRKPLGVFMNKDLDFDLPPVVTHNPRPAQTKKPSTPVLGKTQASASASV